MDNKWKLAALELPSHDKDVLIIAKPGEADFNIYSIARCIYKLDKPASERVWRLVSCTCCIGHDNIVVNRWMEIPEALKRKIILYCSICKIELPSDMLKKIHYNDPYNFNQQVSTLYYCDNCHIKSLIMYKETR